MTNVLEVITSLVECLSGPVFYIGVACLGGAAVWRHMRAGDRRRAARAVLFTALVLLGSAVLTRLPAPFDRWSFGLLTFSVGIYFGVTGWMTLRREPAVTPGFKYVLLGLCCSFGSLLLMFVLPRWLGATMLGLYTVIFIGVLAWEGWAVKNRPQLLTQGLMDASMGLFFGAMWVGLTIFAVSVYAKEAAIPPTTYEGIIQGTRVEQHYCSRRYLVVVNNELFRVPSGEYGQFHAGDRVRIERRGFRYNVRPVR